MYIKCPFKNNQLTRAQQTSIYMTHDMNMYMYVRLFNLNELCMPYWITALSKLVMYLDSLNRYYYKRECAY